MKEIQLTQGKVALVDDEDYEELSKMSWHAWYNKNNNSFYTHHSVYNGSGKNPSVIRMHRHILGIKDNKVHVDHINGNTLDNRRCNLRPVNRSQNTTNATKVRRDNKSGFRGVGEYFYTGVKKWTAKLKKDGKVIRLGYFDSPEEAARAFDKAAKELYGEYCGKLNFEEVHKNLEHKKET